MSIDDWSARIRRGMVGRAQEGGRDYGRGGRLDLAAVLTEARNALWQCIPLDTVLLSFAVLIMAMS